MCQTSVCYKRHISAHLSANDGTLLFGEDQKETEWYNFVNNVKNATGNIKKIP